MIAVNAEVPLPFTIPVNVPTPVPPLATAIMSPPDIVMLPAICTPVASMIPFEFNFQPDTPDLKFGDCVTVAILDLASPATPASISCCPVVRSITSGEMSMTPSSSTTTLSLLFK